MRNKKRGEAAYCFAQFIRGRRSKNQVAKESPLSAGVDAKMVRDKPSNRSGTRKKERKKLKRPKQ